MIKVINLFRIPITCGKYYFLSVVFIFFLFINFNAESQNPIFTFSGIIKDDSGKELLDGAVIQIKELNKVISTDKEGYFKISLTKGNYNIKILYLGYEEYNYKLQLNSDIKTEFKLNSKSVLKEVEIKGEKEDKNVKDAKVGESEINAGEFKKTPAMLGEADVLKSIQLLPGVQASDEGSASLFIRGSNLGQNLMIYDNSVIYNPTHLMGFFSVFNSDAIDKVKLIKSGIPSYYGGRIASVIDVSAKNGDMNKPSVSGGIGLISSRLTLESPVNKGKGSIIVSGRRTYLDLLSGPINSLDKSGNQFSDFFRTTKYYFYDVNVKAIYNLTPKDILSFSSYIGDDNYKYKYNNTDFTQMTWGNKLASLKWVHTINQDMYFDQVIYVTDYSFAFKTTQNNYQLQLKSGARDWSYKANLNINKFSKNKVKTGIEYIFHNYIPTNISAETFDLKLKFAQMSNLYSDEYAAYVNDEIELTKRLTVIGGIRYSLFQHRGPFIDYVKDLNGQNTDTINYNNRKLIKSYQRPEPRISLCYLLNETSSVKASFTQNEQYIHLVSLPSVSMPSDIWIPSMKNISPEFGTQLTLGYFRNFMNNSFESYIDTYYKTVNNMVEFKNGIINSAFEQTLYSEITSGKGKMMGIEFYLKKNKGKITGSLSYTLSKAVEQFDQLNEGKTFYSSQDRRHNVSLAVNYDYNKRWTFSGEFIYVSGKPVTLPDKLLVINENIISEYGDMNSFRLPAYFRVDLSANYNFLIAKKYESSLSFSIFNVLNRKNPYFIYFQTSGSIEKYNLQIKAKQISLFPILPGISWNFKF